MSKLTNKQVRHTFLLHKETMNMLDEIKNNKFGGSSYSLALRAIVKEYYYEIFRNQQETNKQKFQNTKRD